MIFMFVSYFLWELCYTITDVSYWGLSAAISPHPGDRRRVMTSMNVAINVCSAFPYLLVPFLMDYAASPGSRLSMSNVFFLFGMIGGVVGIGLFSLAGFFVKERVEQSSNRPGLRESAAELLHNSALRSIVLSGLILSLSGIGYAFMNYYFIDVLGSASYPFSRRFLLRLRGCFPMRSCRLSKKGSTTGSSCSCASAASGRFGCLFI